MRNSICILLMSFFFMNCNSQEVIKSITTSELKELLSKDSIQLLDVRTQQEIEYGFIESALFANYIYADFVTNAVAILNKNKPVYIYCRSGNRSSKATKKLQEEGFEVYNVLGGYNKWKKEN